MEKQAACRAKRTYVARRFPTIYDIERRREAPSVYESPSCTAPQAFATRPAHAAGNRVRISIILV